MVTYKKPQQRKKEERERLRGDRDQIKFIDLRFERWHFEGCLDLNCFCASTFVHNSMIFLLSAVGIHLFVRSLSVGILNFPFLLERSCSFY